MRVLARGAVCLGQTQGKRQLKQVSSRRGEERN